MRRIITCIAILSLFTGSAFISFSRAQATSDSSTVTLIEVKGNKSISTNTIISKMKTRIGAIYQENVISDDLKRLYLLGYFSDIKIDTESYKAGIKVVVTVEERPIIEKITFTGLRRISMKEEKLKEKLKSRQGQYLDYPNLAEDMRVLEKMYEKIGYTNSEVANEVSINKEKNKATIEFKISEGRRIRIRDIYIKGNIAFSDTRILRLIKTRRAWLFNAGVLKDDVLTEDMERIKSFYRREGYTDVAVSHDIRPHLIKSHLLYISITIEEGKQYVVGTVTIKGNKDISEEAIRGKLNACVPGKVFSQEAIRVDISSIQGLYFDQGYITCQVQDTTVLNPSTGKVDVTYAITENQIAYVDKIKIKGNIKTKDLVIRRELRIFPGDRFDGEKLRRSKERLANLGFFEEISYDTESTPISNRRDLVVDVKESKTGAFSFGGGYSTVDEFVGFVEIEQKNFDWKNFPYFTGGGQDLKFRASFGSISQNLDLSFTEPWVFDYPVSFGFDLYKRDRKRESNIGYGYDEAVTGGDLRLGKELAEYWRGDLMYRIDNIEITNVSVDASNDLKREDGKNTISSISPGVTFDSRDYVLDTKKGDLVSSSIELAGGPMGGDKDFWKFYCRASHYFPMPKDAVLEARGRLGMASDYGDSERIPIYERFFAGGANSIRGYEERKVGPIDLASKDPLGGNALLIGNIEYTYPLYSFLKA
ncbi:MAG: outer membrane protein assembly factor BamA, partial [Candidatus Omnitrophica bacterium]|nr:outer membrane protein assembly factor BamA [Candidatus Omnitrophota bacterium]